MKKEIVIYKKSMDFALRIAKLSEFLVSERKERNISNQIFRSGTSIGANIAESRNAQSDADFISKLNIGLKEADETRYWLELLAKWGKINEDQFKSMDDDCDELIKLLIATIKSKKKNMQTNGLQNARNSELNSQFSILNSQL